MATLPQSTLDALKNATKDAVLGALTDILQGATADVQNWGGQIAALTVSAAAAGDQALIAELADMSLLLAESQRLRVAAETRATVQKVIVAVSTVLLKALVALPAGGVGGAVAALGTAVVNAAGQAIGTVAAPVK